MAGTGGQRVCGADLDTPKIGSGPTGVAVGSEPGVAGGVFDPHAAALASSTASTMPRIFVTPKPLDTLSCLTQKRSGTLVSSVIVCANVRFAGKVV